ncbi:MAG: methyltransferase domain-containing protein [Alphaproteobacteria bacterium]
MVIAAQSTSDIEVFDRHRIKENRERAQKSFSDYDFLFKWSKNQLDDRLLDINRDFERGIHIGSRIPVEVTHPKINQLYTLDLCNTPLSPCPHYIQASEEFLPIAPRSCDLILSNLNLHSVNDLPGSLLQIRQALKNDGLFMASMLGGETLHQLRHVITETEMSMFGGISPRIFPFADKPQMGDLLQRAGFALPVVDSEIITVTYDSIFKLLHDLRGMGEGNAILARDKTPLNKQFFMQVAQRYHEQFAEESGRIVTHFEVIFLLGWAPDSSQQKPLKPGSAQNSLAKALGAKEFQTGEKAKP